MNIVHRDPFFLFIKMDSGLILFLIFLAIHLVIVFLFSRHISKHLGIPYAIVVLIGIFASPIWYIMLIFSFFENRYRYPPQQYPPQQYPPQY